MISSSAAEFGENAGVVVVLAEVVTLRFWGWDAIAKGPADSAEPVPTASVKASPPYDTGVWSTIVTGASASMLIWTIEVGFAAATLGRG